MINHNLTNNDNCHNKSDDDWNDHDEGDSIQRPAARGQGPATGGQRFLEKCRGQTNSSTQKTPNRPKYV